MRLKAQGSSAWTLEEEAWEPGRNAVWESLFTLANGYLGIRGFPEEPFDAGPSQSGIYVAGVFNPGPDGVPELVNVTNFLAVEIAFDGEAFRMEPGAIGEYRRFLDLKRGLLRRSFVHSKDGRSTLLAFERFASIAHPHRVSQSVSVTPLNWNGVASVRLWLDAGVRNAGKAHLKLLHSRHMGRDRILLATETDESKTRVVHACRCASWVSQTSPPKPGMIGEGARIGFHYEAALESGQRATFDRVVSTYASIDFDATSAERCCLEDVRGIADMRGVVYGVRRRRHVESWARRWAQADIQIDGPLEDQRAVRFAVFHLIQSCPPADVRASIAAKGLSGEAYRGHVFWDTEMFMLPFFIATDPPAAKRLLRYRLDTIGGAFRKAAEAGWQGAMFAWESADSGDETCPSYVPDPKTGEPVRVLTGDLQHHVSSDVAYAAFQYVQATGDVAFQERGLLVLAVQTARFWASRVKFDAALGRYAIDGVIGPDEYHERVDNDAYTNFMAAWNLKMAAAQVERMMRVHSKSRLLRSLSVTEEELKSWGSIADSIRLLSPGPDGVVEQFEGFFALRNMDPRPLSSLRSPLPEKERMAKIHGAQVLKQPDVIMLTALFPKLLPLKSRRANWDYYEPRTTHDSSLSPCMHSIAASDLGLRGKAYDYFRRSAFLDLRDAMGNGASGLHLAAMGGTWQALARGFLGLDWDGSELRARPRLPQSWKRVAMKIYWRGVQHSLEATHKEAKIQAHSPEKS